MNNLLAALWPNPSPAPKFDAAHQALLDLNATIAAVQHDLADVDAHDRALAAHVDAYPAALARMGALVQMQDQHLAESRPEAALVLQAEIDALKRSEDELARASRVAQLKRAPLGASRAAITERLMALRDALPAAKDAAFLELLRRQLHEYVRREEQTRGLRDAMEATWQLRKENGKTVAGNTGLGTMTIRDLALAHQVTVPKLPEADGLVRTEKEAAAAIAEVRASISEALGIAV